MSQADSADTKHVGLFNLYKRLRLFYSGGCSLTINSKPSEGTTIHIKLPRTKGWSDKIEDSKIGTHAADRGAIGAQSARMMKRAKVLERRQEKALEDKQGLLHDIEQTPRTLRWIRLNRRLPP